MGEDLAVIFRKWARTNLTSSVRKTGTLKNVGKTATEDIEEIIRSIRQSKLVDPFPTWNEQKKRWWNAATTGSLHEMTHVLNEDPTLLDWRNPLDGWTALHYIAKIGNLRCLDLLVKQHGANVDVQCKNGSTPLHIAVMYAQRLFARSLVQIYHARTDIMDYAGRFPRDLISSSEMKEDLDDLLTSGRLADIRKHFEILKKPHKTSFNSRSKSNNTEDVTRKLSTPTLPDPHTALLLSTLSNREHDYISTLVRRLRHIPFALAAERPISQESKKSTPPSDRKFGVFKIPHPVLSVACGASLWKRGPLGALGGKTKLKAEKKGGQSKEKKGRGKLVTSKSALSVSGRGGVDAGNVARHSFASLEQLTARLNAVPGKDGRVSRHPSNASDCVTKSSSDDYTVFDSASSSLSLGFANGGSGRIQRTSSLSSLVACTEDLFCQYFPQETSPPSH